MAAKKPAPALSSNLVAVKGAALPPTSAEMPTRAAPIAPGESADPAANNSPLNFRVSEGFRRAFRVYAAENNLKLNELLVLAFNEYKSKAR